MPDNGLWEEQQECGCPVDQGHRCLPGWAKTDVELWGELNTAPGPVLVTPGNSEGLATTVRT